MKRRVGIIALMMILSLWFSVDARASASGTGTIQVQNWDSFIAALKTPGVTTIELTNNLSYVGGQDEPVVIPAGVTIDGKNFSIVTGTAGVVLNGDATIKDLVYEQTNFARNAFFLNNHSLTLENVNTRAGSVQMDVFCGNITDTSIGTFTQGNHGQLTIKGTTVVNNIFAGNFSDSKGSNTSINTSPVTVTVESNTTGAVQGFYGCGGAEPSQGGNGDKIDTDLVNYSTTGEVTLKLTSTASNTIGIINGRTGERTAAKFIYNGTNLSRVYNLFGISDIQVQSGNLSLTEDSFLVDDSRTISVAAGSSIDFSDMDDVMVANFYGGGILVLGKSQTINITGTVTGSTEVGINYSGFSDPAQPGVDYIIAPGASADSFTFKSSGGTAVPTYDGGVWRVQGSTPGGSGGGDADIPILTSFTLTDQTYQNGVDTLTLTPTTSFVDEDVNFLEIIEFTISVNGVRCTAQVDGFGDYVYTYAGQDETLTIAPFNGAFHISKSDYSQLKNDIAYELSITVPAENTQSGKEIIANCTLTIGNPQTPPVVTDVPVNIPVAKSNLLYTGSEQTGVEAAVGYTVVENKKTDAGDYVAIATLSQGYVWSDGTREPKRIPWSIGQMTLTITDATIESKEYDGTKNANVLLVKLEDQNRVAYTNPVTTAAVFESETAGENKKVQVTVTINDRNYKLPNNTYEGRGTIRKLKTQNVNASEVLLIQNGIKKVYTYRLDSLLSSIKGIANIGKVVYSIRQISMGGFYVETTEKASIEGSALRLPLQAASGQEGGSAGSIVIEVSGDNIETFMGSISTKITQKGIPTGTVTVNNTSLDYGKTLSSIPITGEMKFNGNTVRGSFAWKDGDVKQLKAGTIVATWVFTPQDSVTYQSVTGVISIVVRKGIPTGSPSYTAITQAGKTLKDSNLKTGTISVGGTIQWDLNPTTIVEANKEYQWVFTPTDSVNYERLVGKIVLFKTTPSNPGSGNAGSSNTGSSNTGSSTPTNNTSAPVNNNRTSTPNGGSVTITRPANIVPVAPTTNRVTKTQSKNTSLSNAEEKNTINSQHLKLQLDGWREEDISTALQKAGFHNTADIENELYQFLLKQNAEIEKADIQLYDAKMLYTPDNGRSWIEADKKYLPADGVVDMRIAVPVGTHPDTHDYYVAHMIAENGFGKLAGEIEMPTVMTVLDKDGSYYLEFKLTGLSPVLIGWTKKDISEHIVQNEDAGEEAQQPQSGYQATNMEISEEKTIEPRIFIVGGLAVLVILIALIGGYYIMKKDEE